MKRCPDCAEEVQAAARKCRYCGYRFDGAAAASPVEVVQQVAVRPYTSSSVRVLFLLLVGGFAVALVGGVASGPFGAGHLIGGFAELLAVAAVGLIAVTRVMPWLYQRAAER